MKSLQTIQKIFCVFQVFTKIAMLVREAGRQYAKTGAVDAELLAQIGSPMIPEETYAKIVNGQV